MTVPLVYGMGNGGGRAQLSCGTGTTHIGNQCKADITSCGDGTTLVGKTCRPDITCGTGTTLINNICERNYDPRVTDGPPSTGIAPHMSGGNILQDQENLRVITANPNTVEFVFDYGGELHITMKTIDQTVYVIYKDQLLLKTDTNFCYKGKCPDRPQEFRMIVPIP